MEDRRSRGKLARLARKLRGVVGRLGPGLAPLVREACLLGCAGGEVQEKEEPSKLHLVKGTVITERHLP